MLKTYRDIVNDGRGSGPIDPEQVLHVRLPGDFRGEDIGYLTGKVDIPAWMAVVQRRYGFLRDLDEDERRWCACDPRDSWEVGQALAGFLGWNPPEPNVLETD